MATLNGSLAIALYFPLVALLGTACAPMMNRAAPGERPAEIILPPTNSPGNLDRIRSDLVQFTPGYLHSHTRPGSCTRCVVDVDIHSVGLTTDITPLDGPARFRIIARVRNNDARDTENAYSLKPATEYLMWVAPAPLNSVGTSRTLWGLLELPAGSTGAIQPQPIGYVERCRYPNPSGVWTSDADFKDCEDAHPQHAILEGQPYARLVSSFASPDGFSSRLATAGGAWFDCGGYCCTGTTTK